MDRLREYVQDMKFKKRMLRGVDEENVLEHIKKICDLAREELEEQSKTFEASAHKMQEDMEEKNKAFETSTRKMQEDMDELQAQLEQYRTDCRQLRELNGKMDARMKDLQGEAKRYEQARQQAEQSRQSYVAKRKELMSAVDALQNMRSDAVQAVREEMSAALEEEKEAARSRMLAEIERERTAARRDLDLLKSEVAALRRQKKEMEISLRREREQLQQHLDWLASRLTPEAASAPASEETDPFGSFDPLDAPEIGALPAQDDSLAAASAETLANLA